MSQQLKTIRENIGMTQEEVANLIGIPIKTIKNWEQEIRKPSDWTINLLIDRILQEKNERYSLIDEENGILSFISLKRIIQRVAKSYEVNRIYLFGSYVKGEATESSDVDLYMESDLFGLDYFEFSEALRAQLNKKIEVLSNKTVDKSSKIADEIHKTGVLIYEKSDIY